MKTLTEALKSNIQSLKEYLADSLAKTELFEMAIDRKEFKQKVESIFPQIVQNWCLIQHARLTKTNEKLINHWKSELIAHMMSIYKMKLRNSSSEYRAIKEVVIDKVEYNDADIVVHATIEPKFYKENIIDENHKIARMFASEVEYICKLLGKQTNEDIRQYIQSL